MKKNIIRINEAQLQKVITESVKKALREMEEPEVDLDEKAKEICQRHLDHNWEDEEYEPGTNYTTMRFTTDEGWKFYVKTSASRWGRDWCEVEYETPDGQEGYFEW